MQTAIPCSVMRGGTSKGLYFHGHDLPAERELRDRVLLAALGSPDARQIDGMGGAHPLTSKVAVIGTSTRADADVDYLFLQVAVDAANVSASQNCGNILAGVGPFAIEHGLVPALEGNTDVRIHMVNTGGLAVARVRTPGGSVEYAGDARIDGVPGTAAPVLLEFVGIAGSTCGALLPTGAVADRIGGVEVTCIDNGMPVVLLRAADFGKTGYETPAELEADNELRARVESIRLEAGQAHEAWRRERTRRCRRCASWRRGAAAASICTRAPSSRIAYTKRSASSVRSAWRPPACCRVRSRSR